MEFTTGGRLEVRLTSSDVGKRVSVRSLTGAGEGAAAYTDTVGVLTSWTSGVLSITRRGGESVPIAESAMVAGKVIPDSPARRRGTPAASVRELTAVAARGWPAIEREPLGEWTLRASACGAGASGARTAGGPPRGESAGDGTAGDGTAGPRKAFTARANSLLPLGDPGLPVPEAIARTVRWYEARGLVPRVQLTTGGADSDELLAAELAERGWTAERHAVLRVAPLAPIADRAPDPRVRMSRRPDADWSALYRRARELPDVAEKVLTGGPSIWFATVPRAAAGNSEPAPYGNDAAYGNHEADAAYVSRDAGRAGDGGSPAAIGRCVIDGRWAGFAAVEVAPDWRRRGLGTSVMAELARRALEEGASAAYLQVETDNAGARSLYDELGFTDHHAYHYRRAPQGGCA